MNCSIKSISIHVNQLSISYTDEGAKSDPVVLLLHGFPLNKSMWKYQIEQLKPHARVIAMDIRGHGFSGHGDTDFSIDLFVTDLICFMNCMKIDKAILCGFSMGGYIALLAMEKHPERFEALVLCNTSCMADSKEAQKKRLLAIKSLQKNGIERYANETIKHLFAPASLVSKQTAVINVKNMIMETSESSITNSLMALANRKETCSRLKEIKVPVLIMVGRHDTLTPVLAAKNMHDRIKDSSFKVIEDAGHLSNLEQPEIFFGHLVEFVEMVWSACAPRAQLRCF